MVKLESGVFNQLDHNQVLNGHPVLLTVLTSQHICASVSWHKKGDFSGPNSLQKHIRWTLLVHCQAG